MRLANCQRWVLRVGIGFIAVAACQHPRAAKHEPTGTAPERVVTDPLATTTDIDGTRHAPQVETTAVGGATAESSEETSAPPVFTTLADTDPNNDGEVAPPTEWAGCFEELTRLGAQFSSADIPLSQKRGQVFTCGAPQVVVYKGRSVSPKYNISPRLTCRMALGLIRFEELSQELARKHFGAEVRRVEQGGTYSCRKMARFKDLVSEHSYANAIDVRSLRLSNGREISIKRHFGALDAEPSTPEGRFLRELASGLYDEGVFSVVLTPFFDRLHHDHFHFDQARYRVDGTR